MIREVEKLCEIMGISLKVASQPKRYLREFLCQGDRYRDGWGIGLYPDNSAEVIKESTSASSFSWYRLLKYGNQLYSKIFVGHLRFSTIGFKSRENNHPFSRELNGKEYVFVHNGTINKYKDLEIGRFQPIGKTDSEYTFCHILHSLEKSDINPWEREDFMWLAKKFRSLNRFGSLNCILSDGTYLFAYKSTTQEKDLYFNHIKPDCALTLDDFWPGERNKGITYLEPFSPQLEHQRVGMGMIISSIPLTRQSWQEIRLGELLVIKDGKLVFSNFLD